MPTDIDTTLPLTIYHDEANDPRLSLHGQEWKKD